MKTNFLPVLFAITGVIFTFSNVFSDEQEENKPVSFTKEIKPLLREKCIHCHNKKTLPKRVSFENRSRAFAKNENGVPYISPGDPEKSLVMIALKSPRMHEKAMPMVGERPTEKEIEMIGRWISEGADWPSGLRGRIPVDFRARE